MKNRLYEVLIPNPKESGIKRPELIEISQENDEQTKSTVTLKIEQTKSHENVNWEITDIIKGKTFRSPLAVMNGIPKSPLNRYIQVTDVVVAHKTWVNCTSPLKFGVGSNVDLKDILPASEIRSERPIRTIVANNLI